MSREERARIVQLVPRNLSLPAALALLRRMRLGNARRSTHGDDILIRVEGRAGTLRLSARRRDAGLVFVSALRGALVRRENLTTPKRGKE